MALLLQEPEGCRDVPTRVHRPARELQLNPEMFGSDLTDPDELTLRCRRRPRPRPLIVRHQTLP
jgi:hypothetical protein